MARNRLLLLTLLVAVFIMQTSTPATAGFYDPTIDSVLPNRDGTGVDLHGSLTTPGHHGTDATDTDSTTDPGQQPDTPTEPPAWTHTVGGTTCDADDPTQCQRQEPTQPPTPPQPDTPAITITDLATFTPTTPTPHTEPHNLAILNTPINLLTDPTPITITATLLNQPAQVRYTPTHYQWNHGDGTTTNTTNPGTTWHQLHQPDFTDTPTSHRYTTTGTHTLTLTTTYTAEYRYTTTTYTPIPGTITTTTTTPIHVHQLHTRLTTTTCTTHPHQPGC